MNASTTYITLPETEPSTELPQRPFNIPLGYLRTFITLLVVAHHSLLAYHPYAPTPSASFSAPPMLWRAFPIVDAKRWPGSDFFVGFNDIFFMALMFFLSGLFVWPALTRKGIGAFLRDRFRRLGLPFLLAAGVLAPIAYYPSYLVTGANPSLAAFWHEWKGLGSWPAGPAWFIWVLLSFDCLAALISKVFPGWGQVLGRIASRTGEYPIRFFGSLVCLSALAYLPMAHAFDPASWMAVGPFSFQTSRIIHYAVYFLMGIAVGAGGMELGLLSPEGRLARRWFWWLLGSLVAFGFCIIMLLATLASLSQGHSALGLKTVGNFSFVLCCAAAGFAFLGLFVRLVGRRCNITDGLTRNAYGIYLTHYLFVSWLQYALLNAPISGAAKGCLVFQGALFLSWTLTGLLRRIPMIARII